MKLSTHTPLLFILLCITSNSLAQETKPKNNLIDSTAKAEIFAPGVVTSPYTEWATSFSADGNTVYFSRGSVYWTLVSSHKVNGQWMKPEVLPFSGKWNDTDPFISPDGKKMFFISNRPVEGADQHKGNSAYHLWYADHLAGDQWSTPLRLSAAINPEGVSNYAPSVSSTGALYFCSRDRAGNKGMQSYYCAWLGDHYDEPKLLVINGASEVQDPFIAPDEKYILFLNGNDIYFTSKENGAWSVAQKLGKQVNNGDGNSSPYVSPDGKTLYYSSGRIQGFYKRDVKTRAVNFDEVEKENAGFFNGQSNILFVPIRLNP